MTKLLPILFMSILLSGELEVDGDLKVTGTIQNDSLAQVIANLQAQITALQQQLTQLQCQNTGVIPEGYCDCNWNVLDVCFECGGEILNIIDCPHYILSFDGGDYIKIPQTIDFDVGNEDFTIDFWFKPTAEQRVFFIGFADDHRLGIDFHQMGIRNINIWASSNGSEWNMIHADNDGNGIGSISLTLHTWHHIAFIRNGDNWRTYIDGVKDIDIYVSGTVVTNCGEEDLKIGQHGLSSNYDLRGLLDEFRWSKGIARWTSNFTPSEYYYPDENTVLLFHFDQIPGNIVIDNSGNGNHGTVHGNPEWVED